jgi:uncharacterized protein YndB with AHSA1/START domain
MKSTLRRIMATIAVLPDQSGLTGEIFIAAPPERVFEAITRPEQIMQWWGQKGMYRGKEWKADVRPGGKWSNTGVSDKGEEFRVSGEYLEVDPPRLLVYTWLASWTGSLKTTVRWELAPGKTGVGTLLKIRHEGFGPAPEACANHAQGWTRVLGWMQAFVETGETVDTRAPFVAV